MNDNISRFKEVNFCRNGFIIRVMILINIKMFV